MEKDLLEYIKYGISISGNPVDGYEVFTIPTQHFKVASLDDLTPERFEREIQRQNDYLDLESRLLAALGDNCNNPYPVFKEFH